MDRNTSLGFVSDLRSLLEASAAIVWDSEEVSQAGLDDWPESSFANTLLVQGLLGGSQRTRGIVSKLKNGDPYSAEFHYTVHPQQRMEPITGADLVIDVRISIDQQPVHHKLVLVQLKRATMSKGLVYFPELHYISGKRHYGEDIHQAEKMLLFSPSSVYWLCVPSYALTDNAFLKAYSKVHNLARWNQLSSNDSLSPFQIPLDPRLEAITLNGSAKFISLMEEYPSYHYFLRDLRLMHRNPEDVMKKWYEKIKAEQRANLLRSLQSDAKHEARRTGNLGNRLSVIVVHATSVLALASERKVDLESIIDMSTPLSEFILGNVVSDGFGDDDPNVLESLTQKAPDEFIRSKVQMYARRRTEIEGAIPARSVIQLNIELRSDFIQQG